MLNTIIEAILIVFVIWATLKFYYNQNDDHVRKMFRDYFTFKIRQHQYLQEVQPTVLEPDVGEIVACILEKLSDGIAESEARILKHALDHSAILYHRVIHVPYHITDPNLYLAFNTVKEMFYSTYGGIHHIEGDVGENRLLIGVKSKRISELPFYFHDKSIPEIMSALRGLKLDDELYHAGTSLVVTMSVLTPLTSSKYWYKRYC